MKRTSTLLTVLLLTLSACAPAAAPTSAPTAAALLSTHTPAPTATPTVTPTATPTPIPTLPPAQLGGLTGVPDPRYSNPELFDLNDPDAPIPQFVHAMRMAGIEVTAETVANTLVFEYRQYPKRDKDGDIVLDEQGNPVMDEYVFGVWELQRGLLPDHYAQEDIKIPLLVWRNETNQWLPTTLKELAEIKGFIIGTLIGGYGDVENYRKIVDTQKDHFNGATINIGWTLTNPSLGEENYGPSDNDVKLASSSFKQTIGMHILDSQGVPKGFSSLSPDEARGVIEQRIRDILERYPTLDMVVLINEYKHPAGDLIFNKVPDYLEHAFEYARSINPNVKLVYNDFDNHFPGLQADKTKSVIELVNPDVVGVQMNILLGAEEQLPSSEIIAETLRSYGKPIIVTEANVNLRLYPNDPYRFLRQAYAYHQLLEGCLLSGVCKGFYTLQIGDKYSIYEKSYYKHYDPNSDPTIFSDELSPKIAYYFLLSALYEF